MTASFTFVARWRKGAKANSHFKFCSLAIAVKQHTHWHPLGTVLTTSAIFAWFDPVKTMPCLTTWSSHCTADDSRATATRTEWRPRIDAWYTERWHPAAARKLAERLQNCVACGVEYVKCDTVSQCWWGHREACVPVESLSVIKDRCKYPFANSLPFTHQNFSR